MPHVGPGHIRSRKQTNQAPHSSRDLPHPCALLHATRRRRRRAPKSQGCTRASRTQRRPRWALRATLVALHSFAASLRDSSQNERPNQPSQFDKSQLAQHRPQGFEVERLVQVAVHARLATGGFIDATGIGGRRHDREIR